MRPRRIFALLLLVFMVAYIAQGQKDSDQPLRLAPKPFEGAKIYQYYCAACHGVDARGHGPASVALKHPVPDLTLIARRTGGKFPYQQVKEIIDGTRPGLIAHGNREMPVWGPIFHQVEADQDWGEIRLDAVTKYIESKQEK
jgi:mono/diheme cytochrome c family protein